MSYPSPFGGTNLVVLIILLGLLGLIIEPLFLLAFIAALGYYLYKIEKRVSSLEAGISAEAPKQQ